MAPSNWFRSRFARAYSADAVSATRLAVRASPWVAATWVAFAASLAAFLRQGRTVELCGTLASCDWFRIYGLRHEGAGVCAACAPCCGVPRRRPSPPSVCPPSIPRPLQVAALGVVAAVSAVEVRELPTDVSLSSFVVSLAFVGCAALIAPCGFALFWFFCDGMAEGISSRLLWRRRKDEARQYDKPPIPYDDAFFAAGPPPAPEPPATPRGPRD